MAKRNLLKNLSGCWSTYRTQVVLLKEFRSLVKAQEVMLKTFTDQQRLLMLEARRTKGFRLPMIEKRIDD